MYGLVTRNAEELGWAAFDRGFYEVKRVTGQHGEPVEGASNVVACFGDTATAGTDPDLAPVDSAGRRASKDHPDFERDGDDLEHRHAISFPQAVFGASVQVPTLDGDVEFDVPTGTQSGERFRLRGKGMPRLRGRGSGDLYVTVQVVTPESLSDEQREALEAFAEAGGEEVEVGQGFFEKIKNSL